jgi:hypothetical protein
VTRLLLAAGVVALLVGCAQALSSAFSGDPAPAQSRPATRACGAGGTPPVPLIRAHRADDRIVVEYEVLARPAACRPDAIRISANSVDKRDNIAPSASNGLVRLKGTTGTVELELPPLDLPPYVAHAVTLTPSGRSSRATTVRIPERGDYCRQSASATVCIERAQVKFTRCLRGEAPRRACPAQVWRTLPPVRYEPLRGATRAELEESFASLLRSTEHDLESVACSSTRECVVTRRHDDGLVRATFVVSGYRQRPGCWTAEQALLRYRACVYWQWNS